MKINLLRLLIYAMKISFVGIFLQCLLLNLLMAGTIEAQKYASVKDVAINIDVKEMSVVQLFDELEHKTDFQFTYDENVVSKNETKISISGKKKSIEEILLHISKQAKLRFKQVNNNINVNPLNNRSKRKSIEIVIQGITVTGRVTSAEDDEGLPGVNVTIKGTTQGSVTDVEGNYKLDVPDENSVLVFSSVGYLSEEFIVGTQSVIDLSMASDVTALSEIVVTAFGIEREKKALGYSVQQIDGDELVEAREINVANSLKGKVAGVFVNSSSGGAGGSSYVQIRGAGSLGRSNQPLYVVDGIPISNDNLNSSELFGGGRDYGDGIKDINPDDIESISVLKGPNAAALYGTRGANGVILITTRKSSKRGLGVSFNSNLTLETINTIPQQQSSYGPTYDDSDAYFGTTTIDGVEYDVVPGWAVDNWGPKFDDRLVVMSNLRDQGPVPYTGQPRDNTKEFYNQGQTFTNSVAVDGSTETVNYRVSLSDMSNKGIIPNSSLNRRTINLRLGADVTDRLHIEAKANYINSRGSNRPIIGVNFARNLAGSLNLLSRYIDLDYLKDYKNDDGSQRNWRGQPLNPNWIVNELTSEDRRDRLIGLFSANYKITDWLNIQARVGNDIFTESQREQYAIGTPGGFQGGRVNFNMYRVNEINADVLLTAQGKLSENFRGSLSLGANNYTRTFESTRTSARDFDIPDVYTVENANLVIPSYDYNKREIQSVYMTGQLAYKNYLFLDLTARNDWSSTLGVDNYSFFYPSASMSFVLTDALEVNSKVLTFAKFRASYAQAGSDTEPFRTQGGYAVESKFFQGQRFARINGTVPPTSLRNELTSSIEFGTDIRLFENRLSIDFTYYDARTSDQILPIGIPPSAGYEGLFLNAGEVSNKGFEIFVSANVLKMSNSLTWDIGINYAKNISMVESLVDGIERLDLINGGGASIVAIPGQPFGTIFGYKYKLSPDGTRVVHESGNYYERADEQTVLGNTQPDFMAGITNTISFKGFTLSALIDMRIGGEIFSWTRRDQMAKGTGVFTEDRELETLIIEGVIENDDGTYTPTSQTVWSQFFYAQRAWQNVGEEFVIDATYVALREVTFGYSFSHSLLSRTPFRTAKLSVVGRNLFYLKRDAKFEEMGVSPESAFSPTAAAQGFEAFNMPTTRSMGFNLSLTF